MAYEKRFVAFLDILGFRALINSTIDNAKEYERVAKALEYVAGIRHENYDGFLSEYGIYKDVAVFSDSIIISYAADVTFGGALFHILLDLTHICIDLFCNNIYVRGAVTYGDLTHNKNICFGPAIIRAYDIEKETIYPRIVVDSEAIHYGKLSPGNANTIDMEEEYLDELIRKDRNGVYWLDVLRQRNEVDECDYLHLLSILRDDLIRQLQTDHKPKVRKKYVWLTKYYNRNLISITSRKPAGLALREKFLIDKSYY